MNGVPMRKDCLSSGIAPRGGTRNEMELMRKENRRCEHVGYRGDGTYLEDLTLELSLRLSKGRESEEAGGPGMAKKRRGVPRTYKGGTGPLVEEDIKR